MTARALDYLVGALIGAVLALAVVLWLAPLALIGAILVRS